MQSRYDYADSLTDKIEAGEKESGRYFIALVHFEAFFDTTGRGEIHQVAIDANNPSIDPTKSSQEVHW